MPRIPGPADVVSINPRRLSDPGARVTLQAPVQQFPSPAQFPTPPQDTSGRELERLGGTLRNVALQLQREREIEQEKDDRSFAIVETARLREEGTRMFIEQRGQAREGAHGFTDGYRKTLTDLIKQKVKDAPTPNAGELLQIRAENITADLTSRAAIFEDDSRRTKRESDFDNAIDANSQVAFNDHTQIPDLIQQTAEDVNLAQDLFPAQRTRLRARAESNLLQAGVLGLIDRKDYDVAEDLVREGELDAKTSSVLLNTIKASRKRDEAARVAVVRDLFQDYARDIAAGRVRTDENQVAAAVSGTELADDFNFVQRVGAEVREDIRNKTVPELVDLVNDLQREGRAGIAGDRGRVLDFKIGAIVSKVEAIRSDPFGEAFRDGILAEVPELDLTSLDTLEASLRELKTASSIVSSPENYGVRVPALGKSQAKQIEGLIDESTAQDAIGVLTTLNRVDVPELGSLFDNPLNRVALNKTIDQPEQALNLMNAKIFVSGDQGKKFLPSKSDTQAFNADIIGNLFENDPRGLNDTLTSAGALYAFFRSRSADSTFDDQEYTRALRVVTGAKEQPNGEVEGGPVNFRGRGNVIVPPNGMTERNFDRFVDALTDADMRDPRFVNGNPVDPHGNPFTADVVSSNLKFLQAGNGVYMLQTSDGAVVRTETGEPYLIDLFSLSQIRPPSFVSRPPTQAELTPTAPARPVEGFPAERFQESVTDFFGL